MALLSLQTGSLIWVRGDGWGGHAGRGEEWMSVYKDLIALVCAISTIALSRE